MKIFKFISIIFIAYGCLTAILFTKKIFKLETLLIGYLILIVGLIIRLIIHILEKKN